MELTKVVARAVPPKLTAAPAVNPEPVTVRVNAGSPAVADVWLRLMTAGVAGLMVKVNAAEAKLPGLTAVTVALPVWARSVAGTSAVTWSALTKCVVSTVVFH